MAELHTTVAAILIVLALGAVARAGDPTESLPVPKTFILSALEAQAAAPPGSVAFVRLDIAADGTQSLGVRVLGMTEGEYDVWTFADQWLGSLVVDSSGAGLLDVEPEQLPWYDFFALFQFQAYIAVQDGATVLHSGNCSPPSGGLVLDDHVSALHAVRFVAIGDDLDARGTFVFRSGFGWRRATVRVDRLDPGPYLLEVDGDIELLLDVSADGSSEMRLREPMKSGSGMMNIWPEGKTIRLLDASGAAVLEAQMPYDYDETAKLPLGTQGFHSLDDGAIDGLQVDFIKVAELDYPAPQAGWLAWQIDASAVTSVTVKLTGQDTIPPEPYGIYVGDEWIGEVGDYPGGYVDPFESTFVVEAAVDPRGQRLEVRQGDAAGLSLVFPQSVPAAVRSYRRDVRKPNRLRLDLLNPGTDLDATGFLDWRRAKSGAERLLLVVRDLPAGAYDVVLDGEVVSVGALVVAEDGGTAKQQFSNSGKPASALPLDFEVQGQLEVRASGQAITFLQQDLHD